MTSYNHFYQQITSWSAVSTRFTLLPDPDALSVINTCRNGNLDLLSAGNISTPMTIRTFLLDHLTGSITIRAGLDISDCSKEGLLGKDHLSLTTTLLTGFRCGSCLGSAAMACLALILQCQFYFLIHAKNSFFKGDPHTGTDIGTLHGTIISSGASASSKEIPKDVTENITKICRIKIKAAKATATGSSIKGCMTKLIVLSSLFRITQHCIGFGRLFKFLLRFCITRVHIWMIFLSKYSVCFF